MCVKVIAFMCALGWPWVLSPSHHARCPQVKAAIPLQRVGAAEEAAGEPPPAALGSPAGHGHNQHQCVRGRWPHAKLCARAPAAGAILMLASPLARYVTGQVLEVNGGAFM